MHGSSTKGRTIPNQQVLIVKSFPELLTSKVKSCPELHFLKKMPNTSDTNITNPFFGADDIVTLQV